jgi:opacity protein-like surface antigen
MLKHLFIILLFSTLVGQLFSQKTAEFGLMMGRSYYLGEVNPTTHWGDQVGSFTYGAVFRYNLNYRYSLKAMIAKTELTGNDENSDLLFNQSRKATFTTPLTDFSGTIEFNFLPYKIGERDHRFSPYLATGFGYMRYDPDAAINGEDVVDEDVSESDKSSAITFLFGPGIKLNVGRKMSLNFEWIFRKSGADDIDGLPNLTEDLVEVGKIYDNDWVVVSGFMLTYKITNEGTCPQYGF